MIFFFFVPHWCQSWKVNKNLLLGCISGITGAKMKVIEQVINLELLPYYFIHPVTQVSHSFKVFTAFAHQEQPKTTCSNIQIFPMWKGITSIRAKIVNGKDKQTVFGINKYTLMNVCPISKVSEVSKYFSVHFTFIVHLYWSSELVQANHTTLEGWNIFIFIYLFSEVHWINAVS